MPPPPAAPPEPVVPPAHPPADFNAAVRAAIEEMRRRGHYVTVISKRRTAAEQARLYAKGRSAPGSVVTEKSGAPGDESKHQQGTAVDFAFISPVTGRPEQGEHYPWQLLGEVAKAHGLEWGGDWKTLVDRPHVQDPNRARFVRGQQAPGPEDTGATKITGFGPPPAAPIDVRIGPTPSSSSTTTTTVPPTTTTTVPPTTVPPTTTTTVPPATAAPAAVTAAP